MVDCGMMDGKRVRFFYKTKAEAETKAALMRVKRENEGDSAFGMSATDRLDAENALAILRPFSLTLVQAARFVADNLDVIKSTKIVSDVVAELLRVKEQDGKSARYLQDMRNRLQVFATAFPKRLTHTLSAGEIDAWLRNLDISSVTRNNFRRLLSVLFGFAVKRRYAMRNPVTDVDQATVEVSKPGILTVAEAKALMAHADPEIIPAIAVGLFAGLRPESEIFRLDWANIDLLDGSIDVQKSKNTAGHRFVKISENLAAWLKPYVRRRGAVCEAAYYDRLGKAREKAEAKLEEAGESANALRSWPADVLRHSYGSYHYGAFKNAHETAEQMGHIGGLRIFFDTTATELKELTRSLSGRSCPLPALPLLLVRVTPKRVRIRLESHKFVSGFSQTELLNEPLKRNPERSLEEKGIDVFCGPLHVGLFCGVQDSGLFCGLQCSVDVFNSKAVDRPQPLGWRLFRWRVLP
jgi:integrase